MKKYLLLFLLLINTYLFGQTNKQSLSNENNYLLIEEKIKNLQEKNDNLQKDINKIEANTLKCIEDIKNETNKDTEKYIDETKGLINMYVFFITGGLIIIGFAVNFFGSKAIKMRVEELILEKAQKHIENKILDTLNSRITSDLIENTIKSKSEDEMNKILKTLEQKGDSAINEIKTKGDEIFKSMLASPPKIEFKVERRKLSDIEIANKNNLQRAKEFFNLAFNSKDPRIQIELYKNVLKLDSSNKHAMNNIAVSFNNLNEPNNAIEFANKAIEIDTNYYQAYSNRAQAYNLLDKYDDSINDADKAIDIEPRFEYAYSIKGNVLTKKGLLDEAEIVLNKAVVMSPKSAEAHYNLAFFYEESGAYDKSLENYLISEKLNYSNKAMLYNNMAVLYRRLKDFDKAIEFIDKAKQFNPDFPNINGTLALIYADIGDDDNFYTHLKIALEKGCPAWNYLSDTGFDKYRNTKRLQLLLEPFKTNYYS